MRTLIAFLKRYNYVLLFLLLEVAAVVMMVHNTYYQGSKLLAWSDNVAGHWYSGVHSVTGYFGLKKENEVLAQENAELRARLASSYISYNSDVFVCNDTVYQQQYRYHEASVIKKSWRQQDNMIMLNMGSRQGIYRDMAVISAQGIVGVVVNTTANFSSVMPILHSNSEHSVRIKRTGGTGTLRWDGTDYRYATVVDIPSTHKLYKNDTIITSGMANDFPEGIMVGYVTEVHTKKGSGFYDLKIRLSTDFNRLNHVYIIENRFKEEQDQLLMEQNPS